MSWQLNLLEDPKTVEIKYIGIVDPAELVEVFTAAVALATKNQTRLYLADCTDMIGGHSITDLYNLIALYEATGLDWHSKEAILLPHLAATTDDVLFYETACRNRGFNVRVFRTRVEATAWLSQ
jgi:hypothetical protein